MKWIALIVWLLVTSASAQDVQRRLPDPGANSSAERHLLSRFKVCSYQMLEAGMTSKAVALSTCGAVVIISNTGSENVFVHVGDARSIARDGDPIVPAGEKGSTLTTLNKVPFLAAVTTRGTTTLTIAQGSY
jgi:hypothetical protein